jgi:CubicO group peptidase (beta-lactamase class C family)
MTSIRWLSLFVCVLAAGAQTPKVGGDYSGTLGPLHLKLHLKVTASGALEGLLDSVDQGAMGLPCANFRLGEKELSFDVPSVGGTWHGTVSSDGATLDGSWSQGQEMPLVFRRDEPFVPAEKPSRLDGIWRGTLEAAGAKLRIQFQVKSDRSGKEYCSLDSLDQAVTGILCDKVESDGDHYSFDIPSIHGRWSGTLSPDGNELDGTWSQGADFPLRLVRQTAAITLKAPPPPKYDPALAPVPVGELKVVLDRDMAAALKDGALAPSTNGGVVIGVMQHGIRRIFVYGPVKEDSIFEIGSISKTFTGLILAQMVAQNKVKLDEPVRELLPAGIVAKPEGPEITLLDLATQQSGLPSLPDNFHPADMPDPYVDYRPADLYQFIAKHGVSKPSGTRFDYSNLGLGLLGQALANRAAMTYPDLLRTEVTGPLELNDTVVRLSPEQERRFAQGHGAQHQTTQAWNFDALAGAGAIRSTASDMLTYLEAQLHPDELKHPPRAVAGDDPLGTLSRALAMSHELRADSLPAMKVGLAWLFETRTGAFWHNGATGGYSSYALFDRQQDYAVVVLYNTTIGVNGSFADALGEHIAQRRDGRPAISLRE